MKDEIVLVVFCIWILCSVQSRYLLEEVVHYPFHNGKENAEHFSRTWLVKVHGDGERARQIAEIKGFHYGGRINDFKDYHIFEKLDYPLEHPVENANCTLHLTKHDEVTWAQQLFKRQLHKRDFLDHESVGLNLNHAETASTSKSLTLINAPSSTNGPTDEGEDTKTLYERAFNDELWSLQWYEVGYRNSSTPVLDMNLIPVYKVYNITGDGVNILIIDDGIEYTHEDIASNFIEDISFNLNRNMADVLPRYEDPRNRHGTRCAGVAVMKANNTKCGVGIAFNAKVGGITLLDGFTDDIVEAKAVNHALDKVHIYSGSWGPQDNGQALDGPGHLTSVALHRGITRGRDGLGSLYVFAAGNGGVFGDHCGADGYINSIYSIAIASATQSGSVPFYAERCPAIMATAYSGSAHDKIKIITTDIYNSCTLEHSGTSASAPLAAGILALVIQANPRLTWRDVHHLLAWTSEVAPLIHSADWTKNDFGFWFTPQFGFGLINAFKMVNHALKWKNVPKKYICSVPFNLRKRKNTFTSTQPFRGTVVTNGCHESVNYLEHVQLNATIHYPDRGHIDIKLISPAGTTSQLMEVRRGDHSGDGFISWPFLTLQFWGENPTGEWTVIVSDQVRARKYRGRVDHLQLILHGTKHIPHHYATMKREYETFET